MGKDEVVRGGSLKLKKGPWTREEDEMLLSYIEQHGGRHGISWRALPPNAGLQRCGKSCRLRWTNYLRPDIKRGKFTSNEDKSIIRLHALLGNRWSAIATYLPKRTDNEIKNYWNTRLKKRLTRMGIDPITHKPKSGSGSGSAQSAAVVSHMAQWETARLEAEARLARESRLLASRLQPPIHKLSVPLSAAAAEVTSPCLDVLKVWQGGNSSGASFFGCLDSPTSTLTFSVGAPAGSSRMANGNGNSNGEGVVLMNNPNAEWGEKLKPEMDNLGERIHREHFAAVDYGCGNPMAINCNDYNNTAIVAATGTTEFEENKNYWNELLTMVGTPPMQSPGF